MSCPICDQKTANCDCTAKEREQRLEIEELQEEVERLRITESEREAIDAAMHRCEGTQRRRLVSLLERLNR